MMSFTKMSYNYLKCKFQTLGTLGLDSLPAFFIRCAKYFNHLKIPWENMSSFKIRVGIRKNI